MQTALRKHASDDTLLHIYIHTYLNLKKILFQSKHATMIPNDDTDVL